MSNILNNDRGMAEWDTENSYCMKCRDEKGNEPSPDEYSVIVRAIELES